MQVIIDTNTNDVMLKSNYGKLEKINDGIEFNLPKIRKVVMSKCLNSAIDSKRQELRMSNDVKADLYTLIFNNNYRASYEYKKIKVLLSALQDFISMNEIIK